MSELESVRRRRVCVESPLRGDYTRNVAYADACMLDAMRRGEAPFLGHLLYPRVLDDTIERDRALGIACHLAWLVGSELVALYIDLGLTDGMAKAVDLAAELGIATETRKLGPDWLARYAADVRRTPGASS
jgi:hypothetical protein